MDKRSWIIFGTIASVFSIIFLSLIIPTATISLTSGGGGTNIPSLTLLSSFGGSCNEPGYAHCYEWTAPDGTTARIALNIYNPPNNIKWASFGGQFIPYVTVSDGGFKVEYKCTGGRVTKAYYGATQCYSDCSGCNGELLPTTTGIKTIATHKTDAVYMNTFYCHAAADYCTWASFNAFYPSYSDQKIRILECGNDADCGSGYRCDKTLSQPTQWFCDIDPIPETWVFDPNMPYTINEQDPPSIWQYVEQYGTWYVYTPGVPSNLIVTEQQYCQITGVCAEGTITLIFVQIVLSFGGLAMILLPLGLALL